MVVADTFHSPVDTYVHFHGPVETGPSNSHLVPNGKLVVSPVGGDTDRTVIYPDSSLHNAVHDEFPVIL